MRVNRWLTGIGAAVLAGVEFGLVWTVSTMVYAKFWPGPPNHWNGYDAAGKSHALGTAGVVWLCLVALQASVVVMVRERRQAT